MLTYLPDDSDRCRVKELMASVRPTAPREVREVKERQLPPPRFDYPEPAYHQEGDAISKT
jgi:hypothetical protein